ncbi:MAG TPA: hypothetical protein VHB25_00075, partial [Gemmatimonadaceae bacterium]|nr:hypothetical protein [Gemmatimonadaceae bacterium]
MALLAALALLSLVALLIAGSFASLTLSQRSTRGAGADELLVASADYALNTVLASPNSYGLVDLPYGQPATFGVTVPGTQPVGVTVAVTRIAGGTVWLVADAAFARGDSARRRVNLVARFASVGALPLAPIQSRGNVRLARGVSFSADSSGDVECARSATNIVLAPGAAVSAIDSVASTVDSAAADSTRYYLSAAQLAMLDSAGALHVRGDTTIAAGTFDGVMVVDGVVT